MGSGKAGIAARAVPAILFVFALAWGPAALAAGEDITGKVVNGTTGKAVSGIEVTVTLFGNQSELGSVVATTNRDGAFSFHGAAAGATSFQATATYKGFRYQTKVLPMERAADVALEVYEPTTSPKNVTVATWVVWVDREGSGAAIQHSIEWVNSGKTAYVGSEPLGDGARVVVQLPLAPGAANFQYLGTFLESPGLVRGDSFVHTQPIVPGKALATLRYTVGSLGRLSIPATLPIRSFRLFVPEGVTVASDRLSAEGQTSEKGITYRMFTATDLKAGETIDVSISGLTGGRASPLTFVLIGVGVVAAVGAVAVWRLGRTRSRRPARTTRGRAAGPRRPAGAQKGRGRQAAARPARRPRVAPARPQPVPAEVDGEVDDEAPATIDEDQETLLIDEIAALDLAYERGFLEQRTYQSLRTATKERLLRLRSAKAGEGSSK